MQNLLHKTVAEFVGVFSLVFMGCGSIVISNTFPEYFSSQLVPVVFGIVIMVMIYALGHISGAHFNPAVTLAFTVARHFPKKELPVYWLAQFLGGISALFLLTLLLPDIPENFGATLPQISIFKALGWEIVLTFTLMFVIISVATDTRAVGTMAGIAIGATVCLCAFVGGPLTGASMNPARSLAPALFQGEFQSLWIYFTGPAIGAVIAALLYEWIRCDSPESEKKPAKGCC